MNDTSDSIRATRIWLHEDSVAGKALCLEKMFGKRCVICEHAGKVRKRGERDG